MDCPACGARLPGAETCDERFQRILTRDFSGEGEAPGVHGLFVATYLVQHPDDPRAGRPAMRAARLGVLREVLAQGAYDRAAFERENARVRAWDGVAPRPVRARLTIADLDPDAPPGHAARVVAWAQAVVEAARREAL